MGTHDLIPWAAALVFILFALRLGTAEPGPFERSVWIAPAIASSAFLALSLYAISTEGFWSFWQEHTRNAWGNQIWCDLLLAASASLTALVPAARARGMRPLPWVVLVLLTGSVGIMAMLARVLYLEGRTGERSASATLGQGAPLAG